MKTVVITGVTGQDGAYLTEQMLGLGYNVFGTFRRTSSVNFWRLKELGVADHPNLKAQQYTRRLRMMLRLRRIARAAQHTIMVLRNWRLRK